MATKGWAKILKVKSIEINVMAMPASADSNAARGVTRRTRSATKAQIISMTPLRKQATNPTFHVGSVKNVFDAYGYAVERTSGSPFTSPGVGRARLRKGVLGI